jgi:hypothetical protein
MVSGRRTARKELIHAGILTLGPHPAFAAIHLLVLVEATLTTHSDFKGPARRHLLGAVVSRAVWTEQGAWSDAPGDWGCEQSCSMLSLPRTLLTCCETPHGAFAANSATQID